MTADGFRKLALKLPEAVEAAHMGHPDFRVGGKIFATLGYPRTGFGAVMLSPDEQAAFVALRPKAFAPVANKWGKQGATTVTLRHATAAPVRAALTAAWRIRAPKRLKGADA